MERSRPAGVTALAVFFAAGAAIALLSAAAVLSPGGPLEPMWRLNPSAREAFRRMGPWAVVLMAAVSAACLASAVGLWKLAQWGRRLALAVLAINLAGDLGNAVLRGDLRALVGVPIAVALIAYLSSAAVRRAFAAG